MPGGERARAPLEIEELELLQQLVDGDHRGAQAQTTPLLQPGRDRNFFGCRGNTSDRFGGLVDQAAHGTKPDAAQPDCRRTFEQLRATTSGAVAIARPPRLPSLTAVAAEKNLKAASVAAPDRNSSVRRGPGFTTPRLSVMEKSKSKNVAIMVVGVDGSAGAAEALRWAVAEARLRKARLRIVHAWTYGYAGMPLGSFGALGGFDSYEALGINAVDLQQAAEDLLDRTVGEVSGEVEDVDVERHVVEGGAAQVLIGVVADADLLVVGSRGHGGFVGLMLGSVSQQCVSHAPCPVVVVHSRKATIDDVEIARAPATQNVAPA